ncbi:MAG: hypothetical protein HYW50_00990 [Candidatus Diapherotrites archaeon]|nr:hypothetical protein [Candidatus Diapherotrites archaeon]
MGDVLISLNDEKEKRLRQLAKEIYSGKKGSLSNTVSESISLLYSARMVRHKKGSFERLLKTMETGYHLGFGDKKIYKKREELYADRFESLD